MGDVCLLFISHAVKISSAGRTLEHAVGLRGMAASMISEWKKLQRGRPGSRFVDRYEAIRRNKNKRSMFGRIVRMVIAAAALVIGFILMFIPGPAILFFLVAGGLVAAESRGVARALDWTEVELRKFSSWSIKRWRKLSPVGKATVALALLAVVAGVLFISYRITFG
jgi:hypothetical protein